MYKKIEDIKTKLKEYIENMKNHIDLNDIKDKMFIAGGAISSLILGETPRDIDIFFEDLETAQYALSKYSFSKNIIKNNDYYEIEDAHVNKVNEISKRAFGIGNYQFCITSIGNYQQVIDTFDFVHTKNVYSIKDDKLILNPDSLISISRKELYYSNNSKFPISSFFRALSKKKDGWNISQTELLKILFHIIDMNLKESDIREHLFNYYGEDINELNQILISRENISFEKIKDLIYSL